MKKYYAVKRGKIPGVYRTWEECKVQVEGYSGALYKSFNSEEEARKFVKDEEYLDDSVSHEEVVAYVDGSFSDEIGRYSYGCVISNDGELIELSGSGKDEKYLSMNNVAGEIFGSVAAIKWAMQHKKRGIHIFHDYEGIAKWADGSWKANKIGTKEYQEFIQKSTQYIKIRFTKVEAHTGIELNERADQLAKAALNLQNNLPIYTEKTQTEELFEQMMSVSKEEKDKKGYVYKNYFISEQRLNNYIKEIWCLSGKKKTSIKSVEFYLDFNKKILYVIVAEKDGNTQEKTINLSKVL